MLLLAQGDEGTLWRYLWRADRFAAGPEAFAGGFGRLSPEPLGTRLAVSPQIGCGWRVFVEELWPKRRPVLF